MIRILSQGQSDYFVRKLSNLERDIFTNFATLRNIFDNSQFAKMNIQYYNVGLHTYAINPNPSVGDTTPFYIKVTLQRQINFSPN